MADAIVYSSTDPGGPGLPDGTTLARAFAILHACLVTGYGDKPGQGWVLVDNGGSQGFTLRSPDGVFVCFKAASSGNNIEVYLAEHLASPYTYPPVGTNVRSQDYSPEFGPSITDRHLMHIGSSRSGYGSQWWSVFAKGSQVLIFSNGTALNAAEQNFGVAARSLLCMFVGNLAMKEPSAPTGGVQNFLFLGGHVDDPARTAVAALAVEPFRNAHTRLRDLITGAVETGALASVNGDPWRYYSGNRISLPTHAPDIALTRVEVSLGSQSIAYLPGVFSATPGSNYMPSHVLARFGRGADWTDLDLPVEINGEHFYLVPGPLGLLFVSTDEAYW